MTMISSARVPGRARTLFVLLATGALAAGLAGAVGAATPETLVKACVDKTTKTVRLSVYASPTWCKSTEVYRYWNVTGPQGPQGEQGPAGPPGETSGGASVVAYPWGEFDGDACGTDWATMGAILDEPRSCGSDAPALEVLTGIEPWGAFPLDPADYPAGAVVSVRFAVDINYDLRPGGAEICLRLVDGDSLQPIEESEVCTSDEGWQQTAPVALGAERRTFGIQARQTDIDLQRRSGRVGRPRQRPVLVPRGAVERCATSGRIHHRGDLHDGLELRAHGAGRRVRRHPLLPGRL